VKAVSEAETTDLNLITERVIQSLKQIACGDAPVTVLLDLGIDIKEMAKPKDPATLDVLRQIVEGDRSLALFEKLGFDTGSLVARKNKAYGNSFEESGKVIKILFPDGVPPEQYQDFLTITRIIDKLFRIASDKDAFAEDPWRDIAGYALLSLWSRERATQKP